MPDGDTNGEDVALLHLSEPVDATPVRLAPDAGPAGTPTRIIGWGVTCPFQGCGSPPVELGQLDTVLSADVACTTGLIVTATETCVGEWFAGSGACFGDSGGPALRQVDGEWQLIGVTSRTTMLVTCGIGPAVYADATVWRDFVETTIGAGV